MTLKRCNKKMLDPKCFTVNEKYNKVLYIQEKES